MTNGIGNLPTTATVPQVDDRSDADRAAFAAASYVRAPRIPTAPYAAGPYTRERITAELAATSSDNERIPFPAQRRSPEQKPAPVPRQRSSVYNDVVLGDRYNDNFANGCF